MMWGTSVVFKLLAQAGTNPWCSSNCVGAPGLGFTAASMILFDTLQFYLPSNAQWADLATYASDAAFDRFSNCQNPGPNSALAAQNAVDKAFSAIGYPRLTPANTCQ